MLHNKNINYALPLFIANKSKAVVTSILPYNIRRLTSSRNFFATKGAKVILKFRLLSQTLRKEVENICYKTFASSAQKCWELSSSADI